MKDMKKTAGVPLTAKELQKIEFDALSWFNDFCQKHGLKYCLFYGTLLGAVRHRGFIPWDDDVDVIMLREDYSRFCELMRDQADDARYRFYAPEINEHYFYPFGKLIDSHTELVENTTDCGVRMGVFIDIFPFDDDIADERISKKRAKQFAKKEAMLEFSMSRHHTATGAKRFILPVADFLVSLVGRRRLVNAVVKLAQKYNGNGSPYAASCAWSYRAGRYFDKDILLDTVPGTFGGGAF